MKTIIGENNWKLTVRRDESGVTVLRAFTCDERAVLPECLLDQEVIALGDHALAPGAWEAEGEQIQITGAPNPGEWDNRALRELTLPPGLRSAGSYALMNCRELCTLRLTGRSVAWGTGVLMNCRSLRRILLEHREGETGEALAWFCGELTGELDISVEKNGRRVARLIVPEYYEEYEENCPAHHFDYRVHGAGQPYHRAFDSRRLDYSAYDALWPKLLAGEYEPETALRLAWWRVCYPEGLSPDAASRYWAYLSGHAAEAIRYLLSLRETAFLVAFLSHVCCGTELLHTASAQAREERNTAAAAVLLEELHRRGSPRKRYAL